MKDYPIVPEGTPEDQKKVLTPAVERIADFLQDGYQLDQKEEKPIDEFNNNLLADLKLYKEQKGVEMGDDVDDFVAFYDFLASDQGDKSLNLEGYNQEVTLHLPLADYIYYPADMTPAEIAAFHYYWGLNLAYTFSYTEEDKPLRTFITDPTLPKSSDFEVKSDTSVVLKNMQYKVFAKEAIAPLGVTEGVLPPLSMNYLDGQWRINAKDFTYSVIELG